MKCDKNIEHNAKIACYLCGDKFNEGVKNFKKFRDHYHYTEKY